MGALAPFRSLLALFSVPPPFHDPRCVERLFSLPLIGSRLFVVVCTVVVVVVAAVRVVVIVVFGVGFFQLRVCRRLLCERRSLASRFLTSRIHRQHIMPSGGVMENDSLR